MTAPRCFYFGCWNRAGHFLVGPDGQYVECRERPHCRYHSPNPRKTHGRNQRRVDVQT